MTTRRLVAIVLGVLLVVPGLGFLYAGGGLVLSIGSTRDSAGYATSRVIDISSPTSAVVAADVGVVVDADTPDWLLRALDAELRLTVNGAATGPALFAGVGPADKVATYLAGADRDQVSGITGDLPSYQRINGSDATAAVSSPADQTFWLASVSGAAPLTLDWTATRGDLVVVLMNADGSPGVDAAVTGGARSSAVPPLTWTSIGLGVLLLGGAAALFVFAARDGLAARRDEADRLAAGERELAGASR